MKSKLFMALVWILVFFLGAIAGAVSYDLYREYVRPKPGNFINKLARDLKLDAQQTASLKSILDESLKRYRELREEVGPKFDAIRNETDEKIKSLLRPDQKLLFEEKLKKCRKLGQHPPPPPPPPPQAH
jgi:hypothetical protein